MLAVEFFERVDGARDVVDQLDLERRVVGRMALAGGRREGNVEGGLGEDPPESGEQARTAALGELVGFGHEFEADPGEVATGGELVAFGEGALRFALYVGPLERVEVLSGGFAGGRGCAGRFCATA